MKAELAVYANQDGLEYPLIEKYLKGEVQTQHVLFKGALVRLGGSNGVVVEWACDEVQVMMRVGGKHYTFKTEHLRLAFM